MSIVQERTILREEIRQRKKEVLPRLREAVKRAQKAKTDKIKACQKHCDDERKAAEKRIAESKKRFRVVIANVRKRATEACKACRIAAGDIGDKQLKEALEALEKENRELKAMISKAERMKSARGRAGGLKAAEVKAESDDEVIFNLGENQELIALFKRIRRKIKKTPKKSRTEAFFEYVHDHPEELAEHRAKKELEYAKEAEKLYKEISEVDALEMSLEQCRRELEKMRRAEELAIKEVPF